MVCPLCRTKWDDGAIEYLEDVKKKWRQKKTEAAKEEQKKQKSVLLRETLDKTNEKLDLLKSKVKENERAFQCSCCKRQIIYDAKYQCVVCEDYQICKLCFKLKNHDFHDFMLRRQPDRDWEPGIHEDASKQTSEYTRIMQELQERELGPDDYDILLKLEQASSDITPHRFLMQAFEKAHKPPDEYFSYPKVYCVFCELEILDRAGGLQLSNCAHHIHKPCLEDVFRTKNECPLCE